MNVEGVEGNLERERRDAIEQERHLSCQLHSLTSACKSLASNLQDEAVPFRLWLTCGRPRQRKESSGIASWITQSLVAQNKGCLRYKAMIGW